MLRSILVFYFLLCSTSHVLASEVIPGKYIVVFKKQVIDTQNVSKSSVSARTIAGETIREASERLVAEVNQNQLLVQSKRSLSAVGVSGNANKLDFVYEYSVRGFSANLTPEGVVYLEQNPLVDYIEPDTVMSANAVQKPLSTWGLDRIDQNSLPLDNAYEYNLDGSNVHAYILDTGIRATHNEFIGRVGVGIDFIDNDNIPNDCSVNGHGTHVAATVGGSQYGVAKNITLHGVKVLDCSGSGTTSGVIAGVDWVRNNAVFPAVANMSLGGGVSRTLDSAVNDAVASGITFVVAAGNNNGADACTQSPARVANVITVASSTRVDSRSNFSNIGSCVDIFGPGSSIVSASNSSDNSIRSLNGTSMASPHVAGVAALLLESDASLRPAQVTAIILNGATENVITNAGAGTPNRLVYSLLTDVPGPVDPSPEDNILTWLIPAISLLIL